MNYVMAPMPQRYTELAMVMKACKASESDQFFKKHFVPAVYGSLAWFQSLIDLPFQAALSFSWGALSIVSLGNENSLILFLAHVEGTLQSAAHLFLLPLLILAGIFSPENTWQALDLTVHGV